MIADGRFNVHSEITHTNLPLLGNGPYTKEALLHQKDQYMIEQKVFEQMEDDVREKSNIYFSDL